MSDVGYLDVSLTNPFVFGTSADKWPVSGGPLQVNGASDVFGRATSLTQDTVWLELVNGNTVAGAAFTWDSLESETAPVPADGGLAPVADVGDLNNYSFNNTNIADAEIVQLDGRASADPENALMQFEWTILERPDNISTAYISDTSSAAATFHPDRLGDYRIQLRVYDGINWSAPVEFTVSLNANITPIINVFLSQDIPGLTADSNPFENSSLLFTKYPILLDASRSGRSNLEFISLSYQWRLISKPEGSIAELFSLQEATTSFVADPDIPNGEYQIGLTLNDGLNSTEERVLTIRLTGYEVFFQPSASIDQSHYALLNEQVLLTANPDHMTYTPEVDQFTWRLLEKPLASQATLSSVSAATTGFNADVVGKYVLELTVSNGYEASIPMQFPVYVSDAQKFSYELIHDNPGSQVFTSAPLGLYYGDLNNDSRDDIFIPQTRSSNEGKLLFQNSAGLFDPVSYFAFPRSLCPIGGIRELNGDTVNELFVCTLDGLEIYRANSSNNLTHITSIADPSLQLLEPGQFAVGDINSDGRPDLAWIAYINTPNGSAQAIKYSIQSNIAYDFQQVNQINLGQDYSRWHSIAIVDIDNDGLNDIVAVGHNYSRTVNGETVFNDEVKLAYYPQQINGMIGNEQTVSVAVTDTVPFDKSSFSDVNSDGRVDLITEARRDNFFKHTSIWIQNSNGTLDHQENLFSSNNFLVADLDKSGTKDIVLVRNNSVQILYQVNSLDFSIGEEYDIYPETARSTSAAIGDIDGDGDEDIIGLYGGAYSSYQIYTLKNLSVQ
ncbi:FG-GAP-like repeat-containing protein [Kaarinaea lacus]